MGLETFWFVLIAVLWAGYFLLEGFDFGVGMLLPVLAADERERSMMFDSIGPVWDGNEVWLVVAGGATFAAFPAWYATMFSGFYLALLLDARAADRPRGLVRVAREAARARAGGPRWSWANTIGSVGAAVHLGRRAGQPRCTACRSTPAHVFTGNFLDLFSAYTVARRARRGGHLRRPRRDVT